MSDSNSAQGASGARRIVRILIWTTLVVVIGLRLAFPPEPSHSFGGGQGRFDRGRGFYRPPTPVHPPDSKVPPDLWRVEIEIAKPELEPLRRYHWNGWRGASQERPEVTVTVREGDRIYTNVAMHLKGAAGSFRPLDDKPALTLNFAKNAQSQKFHGYPKISLNNSVQDGSYLCEVICRELFEQAGVPVPRADHATVLINGRDLGLYVVTEGFGKSFLKKHFKNVKGNLYDGGFVQDVTGNLQPTSGEHPENHSDLTDLVAAASETDPAKRWRRLGEVLDVDRFITLIAMEVITCHWDGYALNHNNYRLFHDLDTGRMVFMPHGLDQMFGVFQSTTSSSIRPDTMRGLVARAVTTTPEGYQLYFERLTMLQTNVFVAARITNRVAEVARKVRPTLAAYGSADANRFDQSVSWLCTRITERAQSVSEQLSSLPEPLQFGPDGVVELTGWKPGTSMQQRSAIRFEEAERDGKKVLIINAKVDGSSGSWRSHAWLGPGRYRFEGNVRTLGIGAGSGGVRLRISGSREVPAIASEGAWTNQTSELVLSQPIAEYQFICELKGASGEAWFDQESLRLTKLQPVRQERPFFERQF